MNPPVLDHLLASAQISREDLTEQFRSMQDQARSNIASAAPSAYVAPALGVLGTIAFAYLLGRHKGRKRATVLEIRRS